MVLKNDASGSSDASTASDHSFTAWDFERRQLFPDLSAKITAPRSLDEVWDDVTKMLAGSSATTRPLFSELQNALQRDYPRPAVFDEEIFKALRTCLRHYQLTDEDENSPNSSSNLIILKSSNNAKYRLGIARQRHVKRNLVVTSTEQQKKLKEASKLGHCSCLLEKKEGKWVVLDCFSTVTLKLSNADSCHSLETNKRGRIKSIDLACDHSALAQVMACTMVFVQHHARRGVQVKRLPWAVLVGKKADLSLMRPDFEPQAKRLKIAEILGSFWWVSGSIYPPEACGNEFSYTVQSFANFPTGNDEAINELNDALSIYVDTLFAGITKAKEVVDLYSSSQSLCAPLAASGQALMVGRQVLSLPLCASPIPGANPIPGQPWVVSQGDLFQGVLNVAQTLDGANLAETSFLTFNASNEQVPVLVKVSSIAVHLLWIDPDKTWIALTAVKELKAQLDALLAVVRMERGLLTIMSDLSVEGYEPLRPYRGHASLGVLWKGFQDLVVKVLLPMARKGCIHPDIRPGYDITANILCKVEGDGHDTTAIMQVIDFESLLLLSDWCAPANDARFVHRDYGWNAFTFVWWQCIMVAYAWKEQILAENINFFDIRNGMLDVRESCDWLGGDNVSANKMRRFARHEEMTEEDVTNTLTATFWLM